jgi:uncharacterized RDD family membrane protein YckC
VVRSPEQVALDLPVAGPSSRMLAYVIDYVVIVLIEIALFFTVVAALPLAGRLRQLLQPVLEEIESGDPNALAESSALLILFSILILAQLVVEWGYFVFCEMTTHGRSLGKAIVGLRVVSDGGMRITLRESLARNLLRAVDILPGYYVVGLVSMIASPEGKRLGDLAAGSVVVRLDRPASAAPLPDAEPPELGRFRFDRDQLGALGNPERRLVRQTLRRLEKLPPDQAAAVLERSVEALTRRLQYEPVEAGEREGFLRALLHAIERR